MDKYGRIYHYVIVTECAYPVNILKGDVLDLPL